VYVVKGLGENYIMRNFIISTLHPVLLGWLNKREWNKYMVEMRNADKISVVKPWWKRPFALPWCK
jgi:hypothetical protein